MTEYISKITTISTAYVCKCSWSNARLQFDNVYFLGYIESLQGHKQGCNLTIVSSLQYVAILQGKMQGCKFTMFTFSIHLIPKTVIH